jgi:hypothetical protein
MGRPGTPKEIGRLVKQLRHHSGARAGRRGIVEAIESRPEALRHLVAGWFLRYLGAPATRRELRHYAAMLNQASEEEVLSQLLALRTFARQAPRGLAGFVELLSARVLGHDPTAVEQKRACAGCGRQDGRTAGAGAMVAAFAGVPGGSSGGLLSRPAPPTGWDSFRSQPRAAGGVPGAPPRPAPSASQLRERPPLLPQRLRQGPGGVARTFVNDVGSICQAGASRLLQRMVRRTTAARAAPG